MLIRDHINLTGTTPLIGARFIDLSTAYSPRLRDLARSVEPDLAEGVYVQFGGPQFETPAEVRMAGVLGGDLVGMSTTLETIAACELGAEVLGISLITNLAAGISPEPLSHEEVLEAGREAAPRLRQAPRGNRGRAVTSRAPALSIEFARAIASWTEQDPDPQTRQQVHDLLTAADAGDSEAIAELVDAFSGTTPVRHRRASRRTRSGSQSDEPGRRRPGGGRAGYLPS